MQDVIALKRAFWAILSSACLFGQVASADVVGRVVAVTAGATIESSRDISDVQADQPISNGDILRTDDTGTVQLLFDDETRIALGPNSHLSIDNVILEQARRPRFVVGSLNGVFRFLSGRSPKSAYRIKTPTATMGIRGTVFDVAVDSGRGTTRTVTFEGIANLCKFGCTPITGACSVARTNLIAGTRPPKDKRERDAVLNTLFPFVLEQDALGQTYKARIESCGDIDRTLFLKPVRPSPPAPARREDKDDRQQPAETRDKDDP